jgi:ribonuclease HI
MSKPTDTLATPSKAEKQGILNALMSAPYNSLVEIRTDSEESLKTISKLITGVAQDRQLLKLQNHAALTSIKYEMSQFTTKPVITWIPAHIGIAGNERADVKSKEARALEIATLPYLDPQIAALTENTFLHMAGTLQEKYPATHVKEFNHRTVKNNMDQTLKKAFKSVFPEFTSEVIGL